MASFPANLLVISLLLYFISISPLIQANLNLHPSDFDVLLHVKKGLGIHGQRFDHPCDSIEIFCEARTAHDDDITILLRLTRIVLDSKRLNGTLCLEVGKLSELTELTLSNNQLVDSIPPQIADLKKLQVLNLRNNRFSGQIPSGFSSLVSLKTLDLSSNRFSGNLNFLKHFPNLEKLSLSDNLFSGKIPVSLRSFRNLRFFNLSGNIHLHQDSVRKTLTWVETDIDTYSMPKRYIFAERNKSFGRQISPAPSPLPSQPQYKKHHKKNGNSAKGWIVGFFVGLFTGMVSATIFSLLFKTLLICIRGRVNDSGPVIFTSLIKNPEDLAFLEKEDGLASLEIIGKGGCGEVYKAQLPASSDGKIIAIKKIIQPSMDVDELTQEDTKQLHKKMRQIRSEIQTVGQIRHRNLVPLLAHVSRPECHYLVYEYMKNGSLQDMLRKVYEGTAQLDWKARHKIALGIAEGLEYLHMHHSPRIIHRDLKPANILLDDDMEAKITDFGLAKAIPDAKTHVTTSNIAGTVGYIAPEYHQTLKFTDKCDIYSFGVLLAVLVTGKEPSDQFFQHTDEMDPVKWLRNVMTSEDPSSAIDPNLIEDGHSDQMLLVLKISCFCTLEDPKQRPNSKDIRSMLSQVKH